MAGELTDSPKIFFSRQAVAVYIKKAAEHRRADIPCSFSADPAPIAEFEKVVIDELFK